MENKLLVSSTYKNNFTLLKYFHNFYNKYWKPSNFLYYVGNTSSQQENIEIINKILNIKLTFKFSIRLNNPNIVDIIKNINIYKFENIHVLIYDTPIKYDSNHKWDELRANLYSLVHKTLPELNILIFKHQYYINVDNDDFLYTSDSEKTLLNNNNVFPTLELVPRETFDINNALKFVHCPYYFEHKSNKKILNENTDTFTRIIDFTNPFYNCVHKFPGCSNYIKHNKEEIKLNINNINQCCFAFTCLSLKHLFEEKYWDHTDKLKSDNTLEMKPDRDINYVKERFYKYYSYSSFSEEEKKNLEFIDLNFYTNYLK